MMTRRDLLASAALSLSACAVDAVGAQEIGTSRADLPRVEILTDTEVRTYLLVFRAGQEVMKGLVGFASEHGVVAGHLTGMLSFTGNVARHGNAPFYVREGRPAADRPRVGPAAADLIDELHAHAAKEGNE